MRSPWYGRCLMEQHRPDVLVADAASRAADPEFVAAAHRILDSLVRGGAALGWVDPPPPAEVAALLSSVAAGVPGGNAALCAAYFPVPTPARQPGPASPQPSPGRPGPASPQPSPGRPLSVPPQPSPGRPLSVPPQPSPGQLVGLGYWTRYERPTHRPHADVRRVAVAAHAQGRGVGRALTLALIASARAAGIEVLTLDARGDNAGALHLYRSLGFTEYGRLKDFVAVGHRRYDTVFCALDLRELSPAPE
jgi:ribosomal protein S18 acetylase RimI-like enzyme